MKARGPLEHSRAAIPVIRQLLVTAVLAVFLAAPAYAQQGPRGPKMPSADQRLDYLTDQLDLTAEQVEEMKPIIERQTKAQQELLEEQSRDREQMREKMQELVKQTEDAYAEVLTPEQLETYRNLRRQRMRQGRRPGGSP
jgi:Spy/CpxP family protein refolding chaperone